MDKEQYRYQKFISDIAGQDIRSHDGNVALLIRHVRDWLNAASSTTIPGGKQIYARYAQFSADLPEMCEKFKISPDELNFTDYSVFASEWIRHANTV